MNAFLGSHRPPMFLFENVNSMDDAASGQESDMDIALSQWATLGYECQRVVVNSREFGIPASRTRMLVIGFQTIANATLDFSARSLSCVFQTMRSLIRVCQRTPQCASLVLLPPNDPAVCAELQRRQATKAASGQGAYNIASAMETAKARGVLWGSFGPSPAMRADAWFSTLTKQQQDAVAFSLATSPDHVLFRDVSQSLGQVRLSTRFAENPHDHCAPAVMPAQMMMVFADGQPYRLLLGREALVFQGFPIADPSLSELIEATTESLMADLAGNMVSTPVMLMMAMAAISSASWKHATPSVQAASSVADCRAALSMLHSIIPSVRPLSDDHDDPDKATGKATQGSAKRLRN